MRTFLLLIPVFLFIAACSKEKQPKESGNTETAKEQTVSDTKSGKPESSSTRDEITKDTKIADGIEDLTYDVSNLPSDIKYDGKVIAGAKWKDKNGSNILVITETKIKEYSGGQEGLDFRSKELFGYHYVTSGGETKLLWKINDFVKDCPLDLKLDYMPNSLSITDLNNNGVGESTFLYSMTCRGDVGPEDMKLMMHENDKKYAIRGTRKLKLQGETYGGETNIDKSFNDAPDGFLDYAKEQWDKNKIQKIGE